VLLGDRIPVLVPFLEDRVEQGAHDLAELLNFRAKTRQFSHEFFVRRRHQNLVALLSRGRFLSFCLRFLMLILGTQSSGIFAANQRRRPRSRSLPPPRGLRPSRPRPPPRSRGRSRPPPRPPRSRPPRSAPSPRPPRCFSGIVPPPSSLAGTKRRRSA